MSKASISNELTRLHALKEKGVLTQEEFDELKNKILGKEEFVYVEPEPVKKKGCLLATARIIIALVIIGFFINFFTGGKKKAEQDAPQVAPVNVQEKSPDSQIPDKDKSESEKVKKALEQFQKS